MKTIQMSNEAREFLEYVATELGYVHGKDAKSHYVGRPRPNQLLEDLLTGRVRIHRGKTRTLQEWDESLMREFQKENPQHRGIVISAFGGKDLASKSQIVDLAKEGGEFSYFTGLSVQDQWRMNSWKSLKETPDEEL